ncbi:amidase family protein [Komagataeibacter rhaeticus]|nr:amidase family protein [Komagataeibacter rhaeticus]
MPFAIKDNIDAAGFATTAACPEFAYRPDASATVVARLVAAGAILVGKTNLDQFATGLNGAPGRLMARHDVF